MADRSVGQTIAGFMGARGYKQKDLAAAAGIPPDALSNSINGKRKWTLDDLHAIARALNVTVADLVRDPNDYFPGGTSTQETRVSRCTDAPTTLTLIAA